jgi:hypothetical protein
MQRGTCNRGHPDVGADGSRILRATDLFRGRDGSVGCPTINWMWRR